MCKTTKPQAKSDSKINNEQSSSAALLDRNLETRQAVMKKYGTRIQCCVPGCHVRARGIESLKKHWQDAHRQASNTRTLRAAFRPSSAQGLAAYARALDNIVAIIDPESLPYPPFTYNDSDLPLCFLHRQLEASDSSAKPKDNEPQDLGGTSPSTSFSPTPETSVKVQRRRVYQPVRVRRGRKRTARTARTASSPLRESMVCVYSQEKNGSRDSMKCVLDQESKDVEMVASSLGAFKLEYDLV